MGDLTANFSLKEFACRGVAVPEALRPNVQALAGQLQRLRDKIGKPLSVLSGWRDAETNRQCGGAKGSFHVKGLAADVRCPGVDAHELHAVVLAMIAIGELQDGGVGFYAVTPTRGIAWVHIDMGGKGRRWEG